MNCTICNILIASHELIGGLCHRCTAGELERVKADRNARFCHREELARLQVQLVAEKANSKRLDGLLAAVQSNAQSWLAEKQDAVLQLNEFCSLEQGLRRQIEELQAQAAAMREALGDRGADKWVIKKRGLYYRPDACGYTDNILEAWVVSEAVADQHTYPHDEPVTKHRYEPPEFARAALAADAGSAFLERLRRAEDGALNAKKPDMPLRDYAIVHFMAALMQRKEFDLQSGRLRCPHVSLTPHFIAAGQADAMLAARKDAQ